MKSDDDESIRLREQIALFRWERATARHVCWRDPIADEWTPSCAYDADFSHVWLRWTGSEMLLIGEEIIGEDVDDEPRAARFRF